MVTYAQALSAYLTSYKERYGTRGSWHSVRRTIIDFPKTTGVFRLSDITRANIEQFLATPSSVNSRHWLRGFLNWANRSYGLALYVPPMRVGRSAGATVPRTLAARARLQRWQSDAAKAAALMHLPQQRLVFLLGYLYQMSFPRQVTLTMADLLALQPRRDDYYAALTECRNIDPMLGLALSTWIGSYPQSARRIWGRWVGRGLPFQHIVLAGATDLSNNEGCPAWVGRSFRDTYFKSRRGLDEELIGRMRRWW